MTRRLTTLIALLLAFARVAEADEDVVSGSLRVEGLAAVVGGLAPSPSTLSILRSDVELRARVALSGAGAVDAAFALVPASLLKASFDELLGEALIAAEARRIALEAPSLADLREERARFVQRAGGEARLSALRAALGVSTRELEAIVQRRAVVSSFLKANLEGTLDVTPGELQKAYESEDHPFRGQPLEQVSDGLRSWLTQRRLEESVSRWVASLRERLPHRVLVTY